jgi:hypothetical protein
LREREYITIKLAYAKYYERKFEKVHNHLDIERERERERNLLQVKPVSYSFWQIPFHLLGTSAIPSSAKLSDSGHTPNYGTNNINHWFGQFGK